MWSGCETGWEISTQALVFMLEAVFMVDEGGRDCFFSGLCGLLKYNMEIEIEAK